jgi:hypothetical protein
VKVSAVVSDLFGKSEGAMPRALVAGEHDPKMLAGLPGPAAAETSAAG